MKKLLCLYALLLATACENTPSDNSTDKREIIETLKQETQNFCERNIEGWQNQWSQQAIAYKMYAGDKEFEEFVGWEAIHQFTIQHMAENPNPIPLPDTNFDYDIYLLGETAWVLYSKNVEDALVRETRFMVKESNQWKIARMQTIF